MWPHFEQLLTRHRELERALSDPALSSDRVGYARTAREHGQLTRKVRPYLDFVKTQEDIAATKEMLSDDTLREEAEAELTQLEARAATLREKLEDFLLAGDDDYDSLIVEIRAGTGGDEAAIFAGDLFEMYSRYGRTRGWNIEPLSASPGEAGGFKEVVFGVSGPDVFQVLRYESGGHRVQRVPATETQGRIHTSAATVAVLPEPDDSQIEIRPQDITREVMRAGGAGGQHVNKTESAVRLWYKKGTPDELEVKCQDERSQHKNEAQAMRVLRSRLFEREQQRKHALRAQTRKSLIGSGDRSDRIRTYNFPQNRLTDHRINLTLYKLDAIVGGEMDELIDALRRHDRQQRLEQVGTA
ncbi:MAG: peptide chain release factor 1 [Planctomycetia bacterium]|nr:peptide chain release factor 1 [Planctomycetia bacterium]